MTSIESENKCENIVDKLTYIPYTNETQLAWIEDMMKKDLSEPYSVFTYRYFLNNWPDLCWLALDGDNCIGSVVCKLDVHNGETIRGYIAMLAVNSDYRGKGIGSSLVKKAIKKMMEYNCDEVVLETEITNKGALRLYKNLGFIKEKRLLRYYLNGVDAFRLKLWLAYPNDDQKPWLQ